MRNQLTNPGEPIRDAVYIYWMDKNWLQFGLQLLYQGYYPITKLLIVKNRIAGSQDRLLILPNGTLSQR
jgi:hypothetical protein